MAVLLKKTQKHVYNLYSAMAYDSQFRGQITCVSLPSFWRSLDSLNSLQTPLNFYLTSNSDSASPKTYE